MNKERLVQLGKKVVEYVRARHVPPAIRNWRHRSSFARYLVRSLIVGIGVEIFLHFAHPYLPGISAAETAATDWAIRFWQDRRVDPQENHEQFTFVDIDEAAYQRWGEPLGTPRDKLLQLVQFAVESRAKLVVVDIELTKRIGAIRDKNGTASPGGSEAPASGDADRRLANYLETYANQTDQSRMPDTATVRPTHILLVRTIGPRLMERDGDSTASATFRQERPSEFLEGIVSQSGTVHWASSLI
ncbi:MAG: CHASE2 domain-containing protein, partial [Nitrospiraceae bacterium]